MYGQFKEITFIQLIIISNKSNEQEEEGEKYLKRDCVHFVNIMYGS